MTKADRIRMMKEQMTQADVKSLMDAGQVAWDQLGPRGRIARFVWRRGHYYAFRSNLRLCVHARAKPKDIEIA